MLVVWKSMMFTWFQGHWSGGYLSGSLSRWNIRLYACWPPCLAEWGMSASNAVINSRSNWWSHHAQQSVHIVIVLVCTGHMFELYNHSYGNPCQHFYRRLADITMSDIYYVSAIRIIEIRLCKHWTEIWQKWTQRLLTLCNLLKIDQSHVHL